MTIIGIVGRPGVIDDKQVLIAYRGLCERLYKYGVYPICLIPSLNEDGTFSPIDLEYLKKEISICDGIILQGGMQMNDYDVEIAKYLYDEDIPTLGICLGMQTMGKANCGIVTSDANHEMNEDYCHDVEINNQSRLFEIIGYDVISVNSLHHDRVLKTDLCISASYDNVIEAIEDRNKKFFIGVQWHPELLHDSNCDKLFKAFFDACKSNKNNI